MSEILDQEIIVAAEAGDLEKVIEALDAGANPNAMGPNSGALHCAAFNGHEAVVELLLNKGAQVEVKDTQSYYPIHLSAARGHVSITEQLIAAGANIDVLTSQNGTALHVAAASNHSAVIPVLIKGGADLEAKDTNGLTPLAAAASLGNKDVVAFLIEAGAVVNTTDVGADTPLIKALRQLYTARISNWVYEGHNDGKVTRYEINKGCFSCDSDYAPHKTEDVGTVLPIEKQRSYANESWGPKEHLRYLDALDTAELLIESGADVSAVNDSQQTPMSMACHTGEATMIQRLYNKGAGINTRDYQKAIPLHRVAGSGRLDGLEQFLNLGVSIDVHAVDEFGWTALHYLADVGGLMKMAHLLLEKGVDPSIKSTKERSAEMPLGCTAIEVALHWKDEKLADVLKNYAL